MAPIIYVIRHGEKPPKINNEDQNGLSTQGLTRAQGLVKVFGKESYYNIGYIMTQHPKQDGGRARPFQTVKPLADSLGIQVNNSIDRDDVKEAARVARAYDGPGNVLICWEHYNLARIVEHIGAEKYGKHVKNGAIDQEGKLMYPGDRFDVIWTIEKPFEEISKISSEMVEGLDEGLPPL